jgi:hypothetical protein
VPITTSFWFDLNPELIPAEALHFPDRLRFQFALKQAKGLWLQLAAARIG